GVRSEYEGTDDHQRREASSHEKIRVRYPGKPALGGANPFGLSRSLSRCLSAVDGADRALRSQKILSDAGYRRGEIGIVRTTLNDHLPLDERLIVPVQIKPGLDRDWTMCGEGSFGHVRAYETANFPSGIRVQFEPPLDAVGRGAVLRRRLEAPIHEPSPRHMRRQIARQCAAVKSG